MKNNKTCPQCGTEFEGRSNKQYCSDKCKMEAFKQRQESENRNVIPAKEHDNHKGEEKAVQILNEQEKILKLELELRRLELLHLERQAEIHAEEKENERYFEIQKQEKDRKFELEKMRTLHEQEKATLQKAMEGIQNKLLKRTQEVKLTLPLNLKEEYHEVIETFLDNEEQSLYHEEIVEMQRKLIDLGQKVAAFAEKKGYNKTKVSAYQILKKINQEYKDLILEIGNKSFFETKCATCFIDEDLRDMLEEEIK